VKRIRPQSTLTSLPREPVTSGTTRSLVSPTILSSGSGIKFTSGCLGCPDEPCIKFTPQELVRPARIESPCAPDNSVCPTGAIARDFDGFANIDLATCMGCGICVVRCPVGAIWVDQGTVTARVEAPSAAAYERTDLDVQEFSRRRSNITDSLAEEVPPFEPSGFLVGQVERATPFVEGPAGQTVLRLLARNAFLLGTSAARLKIVGDNNATCELIVDNNAHLVIVEVEPSADALDAMRRVLAGCAVVIARYGVDRQDLIAALVIHRLPNKRVDYYSVAANVQSRLGLTTIAVPSAALLLAIRAGGVEVTQLAENLSGLGGTGGVDALVSRFGPILEPSRAGLIPAK
jgi:ferredoxin